MKSNKEIQQFFNKKFNEAKLRNPSFSIRAYAKKLGLYPSAIAEILRGQRGISEKMANKLADRLMLSPAEKEELLGHFRPQEESAHAKNPGDTNELTHQQFEVIADWVHFAILSLIETQSFQSDTKWIAERLETTERKVKAALKNLFELSLIKLTDEQKIIRTYSNLTTPRDVLSLSLQRSHIADLDTIREKVDTDINFRDYCAYTLPTDPKLIPKAKDILRRAQDDIDALMKKGNATEVYRLNSYFYPLTNLNDSTLGATK